MQLVKIQTTSYGEAVMTAARYSDGERLALQLWTEDHEPLARLTVNFPEVKLEEDEVIIKDWSENAEIASDCFRSGLFIDTGKMIPSGFVIAPIWKLTPKLKEMLEV